MPLHELHVDLCSMYVTCVPFPVPEPSRNIRYRADEDGHLPAALRACFSRLRELGIQANVQNPRETNPVWMLQDAAILFATSALV